jgi:hypothetical protein
VTEDSPTMTFGKLDPAAPEDFTTMKFVKPLALGASAEADAFPETGRGSGPRNGASTGPGNAAAGPENTAAETRAEPRPGPDPRGGRPRRSEPETPVDREPRLHLKPGLDPEARPEAVTDPDRWDPPEPGQSGPWFTATSSADTLARVAKALREDKRRPRED